MRDLKSRLSTAHVVRLRDPEPRVSPRKAKDLAIGICGVAAVAAIVYGVHLAVIGVLAIGQ